MKIIKKIYVLKEKFLGFIQSIFSHILYLFLKEKIKKEKESDSKIVVGFNNLYYNGNPRAVYEYMKEFPDKYKCFWFVKNWKTYKDVKKNGGLAYFKNGICGIPMFLRTDVWVVAHNSFQRIPLIPHKNYKTIMIWHGIGYKARKGQNISKLFSNYDVLCTSSEWIKKRRAEVWNVPLEKIYATGYPRLDRLLKYIDYRRDTLKEWNISVKNKVILYAPTFGTGIYPWEKYEGFKRLCEFCKKKNCFLIIRLHPYSKVNKRKLSAIIRNYSNVRQMNMNDEPDTMKILSITDILITDWSSIATDFLVAKRAIIYMDVNMELAIGKEDGMRVVPTDMRPGEKVATEAEFFDALKICLKLNRFKEEQEKILLKLHGTVDGKASERVVAVIKKLLKDR